MDRIETTLGDLVNAFYEEFFELYQDEELASLAAATVITDLLADAQVGGASEIADEDVAVVA